MLSALPTEVVLLLVKLFVERYNSRSTTPVVPWKDVLQVFLPKSALVKTLQEYRGVSLLSVVLK
eukprot:9711523-Lingulodinium_polyedra.AAC.1